jgi:hypothetical protein
MERLFRVHRKPLRAANRQLIFPPEKRLLGKIMRWIVTDLIRILSPPSCTTDSSTRPSRWRSSRAPTVLPCRCRAEEEGVPKPAISVRPTGTVAQ